MKSTTSHHSRGVNYEQDPGRAVLEALTDASGSLKRCVHSRTNKSRVDGCIRTVRLAVPAFNMAFIVVILSPTFVGNLFSDARLLGGAADEGLRGQTGTAEIFILYGSENKTLRANFTNDNWRGEQVNSYIVQSDPMRPCKHVPDKTLPDKVVVVDMTGIDPFLSGCVSPTNQIRFAEDSNASALVLVMRDPHRIQTAKDYLGPDQLGPRIPLLIIEGYSQIQFLESLAYSSKKGWAVHAVIRVAPPLEKHNISQMSLSSSTIIPDVVITLSLLLISMLVVSCVIIWFRKRSRHRRSSQKTGALEDTIQWILATVPSMVIRSHKSIENLRDGKETQCAICLEGFEIKQTYRRLPCNHEFHQACIDTWLLKDSSCFQGPTCPLCLYNVLDSYPGTNLKSHHLLDSLSCLSGADNSSRSTQLESLLSRHSTANLLTALRQLPQNSMTNNIDVSLENDVRDHRGAGADDVNLRFYPDLSLNTSISLGSADQSSSTLLLPRPLVVNTGSVSGIIQNGNISSSSVTFNSPSLCNFWTSYNCQKLADHPELAYHVDVAENRGNLYDLPNQRQSISSIDPALFRLEGHSPEPVPSSQFPHVISPPTLSNPAKWNQDRKSSNLDICQLPPHIHLEKSRRQSIQCSPDLRAAVGHSNFESLPNSSLSPSCPVFSSAADSRLRHISSMALPTISNNSRFIKKPNRSAMPSISRSLHRKQLVKSSYSRNHKSRFQSNINTALDGTPNLGILRGVRRNVRPASMAPSCPSENQCRYLPTFESVYATTAPTCVPNAHGPLIKPCSSSLSLMSLSNQSQTDSNPPDHVSRYNCQQWPHSVAIQRCQKPLQTSSLCVVVDGRPVVSTNAAASSVANSCQQFPPRNTANQRRPAHGRHNHTCLQHPHIVSSATVAATSNYCQYFQSPGVPSLRNSVAGEQLLSGAGARIGPSAIASNRSANTKNSGTKRGTAVIYDSVPFSTNADSSMRASTSTFVNLAAGSESEASGYLSDISSSTSVTCGAPDITTNATREPS